MPNEPQPSMHPPAPVALMSAQGVPGYLPGMRQPALLVEFVVSANAVDGGAALAVVDAAFTLVIPGYACPATVHPMAPHGLPGRIAVATVALLRCGEMLVLCEPTVVAGGRNRNLRVAVPATLQSFPACKEALNWVVELANASLEGRPVEPYADQLPTLAGRIGRFNAAGMNTQRFLQAAHDAAIPWQQVVGNMHQFGWGSRARWLDSSFTDSTGVLSSRLARDKVATAHLLRRALIPVPRHFLAADAEDAVRLANKLGWPVVVKPADLDGGRGVRVGLKTDVAVRLAFATARALSRRVLVEQQVEGNDYRVQVCHGQVYWVVHRVPGGVTGDGHLNVLELLELTNADPRRGEPGVSKLLVRIKLDEEALELLSEQGLDATSVPAVDSFVRLRRAANVATGGVPVPKLERAHPDNLALAVRAAKALRLDLAGVDLLMPDIGRSWLETGANICEVNAQPQMSPQLPAHVLGRLVTGEGRIPLVLVVGPEVPPDWLGELMAAIAADGHTVGLAAPLGVEIAGKRISGPCSASIGTQALLSDASVDAAVVMVGDDQMMAMAPPMDRFDTLVLAAAPLAPGAADAGAWRRREAMAMALSRRCAQVLVDRDCAHWVRFSGRLPTKNVRRLSAVDIVAAAVKTSIGPRS